MALGDGESVTTRPPSPPGDEEVLDTALHAFADHGFEGTSVREIARKLGVSHNFVPQRFGTKERLWYAAVDRAFESLARDMAAAVAAAPDDELDRLRVLMVHFLSANAARPELFQIINAEARTPGPRLDHIQRRYIEPVRHAVDAFLAPLHAAGRVATDSAGLLYFLVVHGLGAPLVLTPLAAQLDHVVDRDDPEAVNRYAEETIKLLFSGITP